MGLLLLLVFILTEQLPGQDDQLPETIQNIVEKMSEDESDPETAAIYVELLNELAEHPVKINSGDEKELSRLFFLSDFQIKAIIDHISVTGSVVSAYEIASIAGFDRQTAEMMIPFISLETADRNKPGRLKLTGNLISNLTFKPGENDTSMPGSHLRSLVKYKAFLGPFSAGITAEKDPGESILSGSPPLPDFFSSYISWSGSGVIRKIIAGDYSARFGHGTSINTRMWTGLSLTGTGNMAGRNEIRPYTSTGENNFFRGAAAELSLKNLGISLLFSHNRIDASVNHTDSAGKYVSGFYTSGLHNTASSIMKKDALSETFYGINLNYDISSVRFGITWSESRFSLPLYLSGSDPEDIHRFDGKSNGVFSAYYNSMIRRILLFGEISCDYSLNHASVHGATIRPSGRLQINLLCRNYSPGYFSFHGRGPGSNSSTGNEHGLFGNFTFEAARYLFISAGCDVSFFPWLKYRTSFPSMAGKQELRLRFLPGEDFNIEASYSYRFSMYDMENEHGMPGVAELTTRTIRGVVRYSPAGNLSLTTRIDYKVTDETGSRGMLMLQDIRYSFRQIPVTLWMRHCIFSTDDWDSRIYAYENDLLYSFSIPAFSGKGIRSYLMAEWEIGEKAEVRVKYGLTTVIDVREHPAERDELKFQFRLWF